MRMRVWDKRDTLEDGLIDNWLLICIHRVKQHFGVFLESSTCRVDRGDLLPDPLFPPRFSRVLRQVHRHWESQVPGFWDPNGFYIDGTFLLDVD